MTEQPFREEQDPREDHDGAEPQPAPFPPELDPPGNPCWYYFGVNFPT